MAKLGFVLAGCVVFALAGLGQAQKADNKDKIVGTWEVTKGDVPPGTTIEFTKDGKVKIVIKDKDKTLALDGTYKVDGDKLMTVMKFGDKEMKETMTIKTLTDKVLITLDEKGKTDEFKKK